MLETLAELDRRAIPDDQELPVLKERKDGREIPDKWAMKGIQV